MAGIVRRMDRLTKQIGGPKEDVALRISGLLSRVSSLEQSAPIWELPELAGRVAKLEQGKIEIRLATLEELDRDKDKALFSHGKRLDDLEACLPEESLSRHNARLDDLKKVTTELVDASDGVQGKLSALDRNQTCIEARLGSTEARLGSLENNVADHEQTIAELDNLHPHGSEFKTEQGDRVFEGLKDRWLVLLKAARDMREQMAMRGSIRIADLIRALEPLNSIELP